MAGQNFLNRFSISVGLVGLVAAVGSWGLDAVGMAWFSQFLQMFSAVTLASAIVGTLLIEAVRTAIWQMPAPVVQTDVEIQYYLEKELHALQQEFAKLSVQYETIVRELEGLETQISTLDDTVSNLGM